MNERIKDLAEQAGIFFGGHPMNPLSVYFSDLKRFAELVRQDERQALAQPDQTPVAWMDNDGNVCDWECPGFSIPLYTTKGISK